MKNDSVKQKEVHISSGKQFQGVVSSDKMKDTVVVVVERYFKHQNTKSLFLEARSSWPTMLAIPRKLGTR